ncbi:MAG: hypothetical protein JRD93_09100 [Deltaproteobacteria bacterium]|nr:hypothetical protein [Deltaproteobacteria bacterium]
MNDMELLSAWKEFRASFGLWFTLCGGIPTFIWLIRKWRVERTAKITCYILLAIILIGLLAMAFDQKCYTWLCNVPAVFWNFYFVSHLLLTVGILAFIGGMLVYCSILHFIMGRNSVCIRSMLYEKGLDLISGHRRFKIIQGFKEYCNSCEQLLLRAAKDVGKQDNVEMHTVQTPAKSATLSDEDKKAYQNYMATTNRILLTHDWGYNRLVYLPPSEEDFGDAFARSYEFIRTLLYEYFFGFDKNSEKHKPESVITPPKKYYPNGAAQYAKQNRPDESGPINLEGIRIGYTAKMDGLLDVVSRLDLHIPPSHEFSIAFSQVPSSQASNDRKHETQRADRKNSESIGNNFIGCIRVFEYQKRNSVASKNITGVRTQLIALLEEEWGNIEKEKSQVLCALLINSLPLKPFFEKGWGPQEIAFKWIELELDDRIFMQLCKASAKAIAAGVRETNKSVDWKRLFEKAKESIQRNLSVSVNVKTDDIEVDDKGNIVLPGS